MANNLYLVRGLPNSGKTTIARELAPNCNYCADDWFLGHAWNENITYQEAFQKYKHQMQLAHDDCLRRTKMALEGFASAVAVHNTFSMKKELQPYMDLGAQYKYRVHIIMVERTHDGDNGHLVPEQAINKMKQRWEKF